MCRRKTRRFRPDRSSARASPTCGKPWGNERRVFPRRLRFLAQKNRGLSRDSAGNPGAPRVIRCLRPPSRALDCAAACCRFGQCSLLRDRRRGGEESKRGAKVISRQQAARSPKGFAQRRPTTSARITGLQRVWLAAGVSRYPMQASALRTWLAAGVSRYPMRPGPGKDMAESAFRGAFS